jgi:hypothetical protein
MTTLIVGPVFGARPQPPDLPLDSEAPVVIAPLWVNDPASMKPAAAPPETLITLAGYPPPGSAGLRIKGFRLVARNPSRYSTTRSVDSRFQIPLLVSQTAAELLEKARAAISGDPLQFTIDITAARDQLRISLANHGLVVEVS